ncbi:putative dolichol kinase [Encephalitozoon romaleae SJ-2008]|uniref:dolichol kinase n=1 Tax=Encephalitozoon romaleae (strain SJ-2008) TaxID=1178016 RepID=I6ZHY8_ENCRO|nr:putative dolichol kinase [Encephalitozoon romaleae SJ-2008]AFN82828.1 putative dolichol kinase [Encephalitozoon romaleae SJ-2008]
MRSSLSYIILLDIVDLVVETASLETCRSTSQVPERWITAVILKCIEQKIQIRSPLLGVRYAIFSDPCKPLLAKISECLQIVNIPEYIFRTIDEMKQEPYAFIEVVCISLGCLLMQTFLFRSSWTNLKRKTFHFFAFLVFYKEYRMSLVLGEGLLLVLGLLSSCKYVNSLFKPYLSKNDKGRTVLSHIYLLSACIYPRLFIRHVEYVSVLVSICFQDSMASIIGEWLGKTEKSIQGSIGGTVSGTMVYFTLYRKIDMVPFFVFIGITEYLIPINDNVSIPLFAVLYFQILKRFNPSNNLSWGWVSLPSGSLS